MPANRVEVGYSTASPAGGSHQPLSHQLQHLLHAKRVLELVGPRSTSRVSP